MALVDLLVDEVLDHRSVALAAPHDGIEEPEVLRRVDGSSVYTVAGADLYTSQRILDAEQRHHRRTTRRIGRRRHGGGSALLEMAATAAPSMSGRRPWSARCARRCLFAARIAPLAPARPPRCVPSHWPGPKTAAR